jgi:C4-type Zn-finger protein
VDVWFQRNVNCPVCRHDIRIHTPATRSPALSSTTPSAAPPSHPL